MRRTAGERFWEKVDKSGGPDGCWLWTGAHDSYGQFYLEGRNHQAHRIALFLEHGEHVPPGMEACHECDVKLCVNPAHLYVGSHAENMKEAFDKGMLPSVLKKQTVCKNGHEFSPANTEELSNGTRRCRICQLRRARESFGRRLSQPAERLLWQVAQHRYGWKYIQPTHRGAERQIGDGLVRRGLVVWGVDGTHMRDHETPAITITDAGREAIRKRWPVSPLILETYEPPEGGWPAFKGDQS